MEEALIILCCREDKGLHVPPVLIDTIKVSERDYDIISDSRGGEALLIHGPKPERGYIVHCFGPPVNHRIGLFLEDEELKVHMWLYRVATDPAIWLKKRLSNAN